MCPHSKKLPILRIYVSISSVDFCGRGNQCWALTTASLSSLTSQLVCAYQQFKESPKLHQTWTENILRHEQKGGKGEQWKRNFAQD